MMKGFSRKKNFNKTNIEKMPESKPIIYKIKNLKGENIYTGIAKKGRIKDRLKEHLPKNKDVIPGGESFSVKKMRTIRDAEAEEKIIIKKENPKYNKQD